MKKITIMATLILYMQQNTICGIALCCSYKMTKKERKEGYFGYGLQIGLFGVHESYFDRKILKLHSKGIQGKNGILEPLWEEWKIVFEGGFDEWITNKIFRLL